MEQKNLFDRYYYLTSCGISYDKKENWEAFFGAIADRIIKDIRPSTVLDAGCAYGYLVAALRDRGVEAYGIDISAYAISQVRPDIKQYCKVGSVLDKPDRSYDLIICIEVLEHMKPQESVLAIENLCKHTGDFIFTSTSADFKEATHFNVQPTEYWARLFANYDFYRDTAFDGSFIISHAIRFRKNKQSIPEIIYNYEKAFYKNFSENQILREELIQARLQLSNRFDESESTLLSEKNNAIGIKDQHINNLDEELNNKSGHINELSAILNVKEDYIGFLETQLKQKEEELNRLNEQTKLYNKSLNELDKQQLAQIEKIVEDGNKSISEKDRQIKVWEDHLKKFETHMQLLDKVMQEKEESLKVLTNQLHQLQGFINSLNESISDKDEQIQQLTERNHQQQAEAEKKIDEYSQSLNEISGINNDMKQKLIAAYQDKNTKDRLIHELNLQVSNVKHEADRTVQQKQEIIREFERIKGLKGYKFLMKYYKVRDGLLMRTPKRPKAPVHVPQTVPVTFAPQAESAHVSDSRETILHLERRYYSKNPIYNIEFNYVPLISIVVPVFNTPIKVLEEMIESVLYQTYTNLELCIVNASAGNAEIAACIQRYAKTNDCIVYCEVENKGISENTNAGIKMSKGEFIGLLDHDDIITPNALYEVVSRLQDDISAWDFFYSDKDMILEDGKSSVNPLYKPTWSPEIMLSANYLTHFCVIRKSLIEKAGYLDTTTDGSQDWDIFLKVSRLTDKICHVPYKSYHWRIIQTSVASGIGAKPYALQAQLTCLRNHLAALELKASVDFVSQEKGIIKVSWDASHIKTVSFIINYSGKDHLLRKLLKQIDSFKEKPGYKLEILLLTEKDNTPADLDKNIRVVKSFGANKHEMINSLIPDLKGEVVVFADSGINFINEDAIAELVAWAAQKQYGAISPKIIDKNDRILSTGLVFNGNSVIDIFRKAQRIEYTIFGYSEWYRNISAVREECFAIKTSLFKEVGHFKSEFREFTCADICLRLLQYGYRNVYTPFAVAQIQELPQLSAYVQNDYYSLLRQEHNIKECDRYWNINLLPADSMPVENKRKMPKLSFPAANAVTPQTGWERYSSDALYLAHAYDFSTADFEKNVKWMESNKDTIDIKSVTWFLPQFDFIYYAGLYTIFRTANHLQSVKGVKNTFVIVGGINPSETYEMIIEAFPLLKDSKVECIGDISSVSKLPYSDAAICSLWTTAYYLLRFNKTKRKFYFIQDFEPLFYPAGSTYGQAETTYKLGYYGITNTQGIKDIYEGQYGGKAIDLKPCIDTSVFNHHKRFRSSDGKYRVFFYGRPGHPRNGFELGSTALRILKTKLRDKVEIYCAGSDWDPAEYGLEGVLINVGRMDFEKTADLYRACDAGLVMMFTKHPSYLPFELMACGCAVVSNYNDHTKWFLKDKENCLLTEATATRIAETIEKVLLNQDLKNELVKNAVATIQTEHSSWNIELNAIYEFMCAPEKFNGKEKIQVKQGVSKIGQPA